MGVGLEAGGVDELDDAMDDVHAVGEPAESGEEAPGEEVVDEATMAIVAGPDDPADGQGPGGPAEGLEEGALDQGRVGGVGQDAPVGSPHAGQHRSKGHEPSGQHQGLAHRDLASTVPGEQEVPEDHTDQPGGDAGVGGIVGQPLAEIDMIVLDTEQGEVIVHEGGEGAAETQDQEDDNRIEGLLAPLPQRDEEQRRQEVQLGVHSQVPGLRDALKPGLGD